MSNEQNAAKEFTKRPVTIQAIQWTGDNLRAVITFMEGAVVTNDLASAARWDDYRDLVEKRGLIIKTLEGQHIASVGDWIIKGVKGEHYPCKPDIFEMTYAAPQPSDDAKEALVEALEELVKINEDHNKAVQEIIGGGVTLNWKDSYLDKAREALAAYAAPQPSDAYRMAVDTGLVCAHLGVTNQDDDYETARKKLNDLICWSVQVDRDLSDDARDAARYRWLLNNAGLSHWENMLRFADIEHLDDISKCIDAAMGSKSDE